MFSNGHLLWIGISVILIAGGFAACRKKRPDIDKVLKVCLILGLCSEVVKIFSVARILPMVTPVISVNAEEAALDYTATGQYSPYLELAHLPFELCSLQIVFMAAALWSGDGKWKRRFLAIIYATGILGGFMGIVLAALTVDYTTAASYFASPRIWQYFLYHSMVVVLGLYVGFVCEDAVSFKDFKGVIAMLISMDFLSFYLNSLCSQPVYIGEKPVGLVYRTNFFSSYVNPLGLVLTEKWQWILYLLIRAALAVSLILLLFLLRRRKERLQGARIS